MGWWAQLPRDMLDLISELKKNVLFRNIAKLLIVLHYIKEHELEEHYANILRELFDGNYINIVKDADRLGYVNYRREKPPVLTPKGEHLAEVLYECWENLRRDVEYESLNI